MSMVTITNKSLKFNEAGAVPNTVAVDTVDGARIDYSNKEDARILVIIENAATAVKTATVKAGTGIQGVSDLNVEVPASGRVALCLESGAYLQTTGNNKGYIIITGADANIKVAAVELP